jgi:hypothetical protein
MCKEYKLPKTLNVLVLVTLPVLFTQMLVGVG